MRRAAVACACILPWLSPAATWICGIDGRGHSDATSFVVAFTNASRIVRAEWRVSGLGVFQAFANGLEVGGFLKPGYTHVTKCRHVYSYDVTDKLKLAEGECNVLSATVAGGWWRDEIIESADADLLPFEDELGVDSAFVGEPYAKFPGDYVKADADNAFWGELAVTYADGAVHHVGTGPDWRAAHEGKLKAASIYDGESFDDREDESWRYTGRCDWPHAALDRQFRGEMRESSAEVVLRTDLVMCPVDAYLVKGVVCADSNRWGVARVVRRYEMGEVMDLNPGHELVVDFGQNAAAVVEVEVEGDVGAELHIRHAEMLNEGCGDKSRGNDGPEGTPYVANLRASKASVRYVLGKGGRQTYRPSYSFFGFRYAGITATSPVRLLRIRSVPVTSIRKEMECGALETGVPELNRLISNIRWGLYSNYLSIPTDCPQRDERYGWTGDTAVFVDAAMYSADVLGFLRKWMTDMRDSQCASGAFPVVAPIGSCGREGGVSGWSDAGILVPYRLWRRYGDIGIIRENWTAMTRYMEFLIRTGGHPSVCYGDWLAYEKNDEPVRRFLADAYYYMDAKMMTQMAEAVAEHAATRRYRAAAEGISKDFAHRHLDPEGCVPVSVRTQTTLLIALKSGLLSPSARVRTGVQLVENIHTNGDRLQTGFIGTAYLLDVLTEIGESELATTLLLQRKEPSWLYSVDQGATTVWERWNGYTRERGFGPVSMNSFNHYAYGAVLAWMYSSLAGIREDPDVPGMKRFRLSPHPDRRLGRVSAHYRTRYGVIESEWRYGERGGLVWRYVVPDGTTAVVTSILSGDDKEVGPGAYVERVEPVVSNAMRMLRPIGGLTKILTAATVLALVDEGLLDLDCPIGDYLNDRAFGMSLRQALSCTAGFRKGHPGYPADVFSVDQLLAYAREELTASKVPGTDFVYGPWGYYLAMATVEKVSGRTLEDVMRERILIPLGMTNTVFFPDDKSENQVETKAYPWLTVPFNSKIRKVAPDCGLFSTVSDLGLFGKMLLANGRNVTGKRVLSEASVQAFFTKQTGKLVDRSFSFGFNVLSADEVAFESSTGNAMRINRAAHTCDVK